MRLVTKFDNWQTSKYLGTPGTSEHHRYGYSCGFLAGLAMGMGMGRQIETCAKPVPGCGVATPSKNGMPRQLSITTTTTTTTDQQQQCSNNAWCTMSANTAHNNVATTYSAQQVPTTTQ